MKRLMIFFLLMAVAALSAAGQTSSKIAELGWLELPAFSEDPVHGYLQCFDHSGKPVKPVAYCYLEGGLRIKTAPQEVPTEDGLLVLRDNTFEADAFILEESAVAAAALLDKDRREVLRVECPQAQAYGLWGPKKSGCPFVCIEPWCGIADRKGFTGDISQRDCDHALEPGESYEFRFTIKL